MPVSRLSSRTALGRILITYETIKGNIPEGFLMRPAYWCVFILSGWEEPITIKCIYLSKYVESCVTVIEINAVRCDKIQCLT